MNKLLIFVLCAVVIAVAVTFGMANSAEAVNWNSSAPIKHLAVNWNS